MILNKKEIRCVDVTSKTFDIAKTNVVFRVTFCFLNGKHPVICDSSADLNDFPPRSSIKVKDAILSKIYEILDDTKTDFVYFKMSRVFSDVFISFMEQKNKERGK